MKNWEELHEALRDCARRARDKHLTIGEVLDGLGEASYPFLAILFAVPMLVPVSLGPVATAAGISLAALGFQLMTGRPEPWLPRRVRAIVLPEKVWLVLIGGALRLFTFCRSFTRPRGERWVTGRRGRILGGAVIGTAGFLIAIPFIGVPLNNTIPGFAAVFACIAELERDAAMLWVALAWLVLSVAYFTFVVWLVFVVGVNAFEWLGWGKGSA
ncbi:MAG TPA: exopolysaccharide biosynthesis protein [Candidatus Polarisedimenticolaceae bacterium]